LHVTVKVVGIRDIYPRLKVSYRLSEPSRSDKDSTPGTTSLLARESRATDGNNTYASEGSFQQVPSATLEKMLPETIATTNKKIQKIQKYKPFYHSQNISKY
jgi:hypothetical protein